MDESFVNLIPKKIKQKYLATEYFFLGYYSKNNMYSSPRKSLQTLSPVSGASPFDENDYNERQRQQRKRCADESDEVLDHLEQLENNLFNLVKTGIINKKDVSAFGFDEVYDQIQTAKEN